MNELKAVGFLYTYYAGSDYDNQNLRQEVISIKNFENLDESEKEDADLIPLYAMPGEMQLVPISLLADISSMCVGQLTMGYPLDANSIGQMIFEATGMTQLELDHTARKAVNEGNQ